MLQSRSTRIRGTRPMSHFRRSYVHIAYALPSRKSESWIDRIRGYARPTNLGNVVWPTPVHAPYSITKAISDAFSDEYTPLLYDLRQRGEVSVGENDLFLGHPWPDVSTKKQNSNCWTKYDRTVVSNRTVLRNPRRRNVMMISPFNTDLGQVEWVGPLLKKCSVYIGICGDFWAEKTSSLAGLFGECKFEHLNMAIDTDQYSACKESFAPPGERRFLYIGRVSDEKNTAMLTRLAERIPGFRCDYIAQGRIDNCTKIADNIVLTNRFVAQHLSKYDVFLSPSRADAQATTVLEAMSWGLVVAATRESGYDHDSIFRLSTDDVEYNVNVIKRIQSMNGSELHERVLGNFNLIREKYSWSVFKSKLKEIVTRNLNA